MDTSPKTCCYRSLTSSPLLAELMVVMGGVTTAELVRGNLAYVCTLYTIRDVSVMSIPVSPKHFLHFSVECRPSIASFDLLTFQNKSVNIVFSGWQDFIET